MDTGESCTWISGPLYERLTFRPHCTHIECIISKICGIAGKVRTGVVSICEVKHQRGWHVDKWRCLNEDDKAQKEKRIGRYRRSHRRFGKGKDMDRRGCGIAGFLFQT